MGTGNVRASRDGRVLPRCRAHAGKEGKGATELAQKTQAAARLDGVVNVGDDLHARLSVLVVTHTDAGS